MPVRYAFAAFTRRLAPNGGEPITAADKQLLIDWLGMGAPDAASWSG